MIALIWYFKIASVKDFRTSDLFTISMYLNQLEDNLRACLNTAIFYAELKNCTVRIQEILTLPESAQFMIENETFDVDEHENNPEIQTLEKEYKISDITVRSQEIKASFKCRSHLFIWPANCNN